jgi:hypothetical protein
MNDPKSVWQNLSTKGEKMSAVDVRIKAEKLDAENRRDTILGFAVATVLTLIGLMGLATLEEAGPAERLIVAIAVSLLWFGAYRTSVRRRGLAADASFAACIEFYRKEVERRRNYFRAQPWGFLVVMIIALLQFVIVMRPYKPSARDLLMYPIVIIGLLLGVLPYWIRQKRRFQREMDALDAFEKGMGAT